MDRNVSSGLVVNGTHVALRKESVDRNSNPTTMRSVIGMSLSARRAWIEILTTGRGRLACGSLSARRAWIEIADEFMRFNAMNSRSPQGERG